MEMQKMIQEIHSFDEYEDFIGELAVHPLYSDPHFTYDKDNLYRSLKAKDDHAFAVLENAVVTTGLNFTYRIANASFYSIPSHSHTKFKIN